MKGKQNLEITFASETFSQIKIPTVEVSQRLCLNVGTQFFKRIFFLFFSLKTPLVCHFGSGTSSPRATQFIYKQGCKPLSSAKKITRIFGTPRLSSKQAMFKTCT